MEGTYGGSDGVWQRRDFQLRNGNPDWLLALCIPAFLLSWEI